MKSGTERERKGNNDLVCSEAQIRRVTPSLSALSPSEAGNARSMWPHCLFNYPVGSHQAVTEISPVRPFGIFDSDGRRETQTLWSKKKAAIARGCKGEGGRTCPRLREIPERGEEHSRNPSNSDCTRTKTPSESFQAGNFTIQGKLPPCLAVVLCLSVLRIDVARCGRERLKREEIAGIMEGDMCYDGRGQNSRKVIPRRF